MSGVDIFHFQFGLLHFVACIERDGSQRELKQLPGATPKSWPMYVFVRAQRGDHGKIRERHRGTGEGPPHRQANSAAGQTNDKAGTEDSVDSAWMEGDIGSCLSCQQSSPRRKSKSGKKQNRRILARFIDFLHLLPHAHASTTLAL